MDEEEVIGGLKEDSDDILGDEIMDPLEGEEDFKFDDNEDSNFDKDH